LPESALQLVSSWLATPTWEESQEFWEAHVEELAARQTAIALDEFALVANVAQQHQAIREAILSADASSVFHQLILRDLLATWLECGDWVSSQEFLEAHREALSEDLALGLLSTFEPKTAAVRVHEALLHLVRSTGVEAAYECVRDGEALRARVSVAVSDADASMLANCAVIEGVVFGEGASCVAHLQAAHLLADNPDAVNAEALADAASEAEPETRNRLVAELASLSARSGTQHLELWMRMIRALTEARSAAPTGDGDGDDDGDGEETSAPPVSPGIP
jgi:hypothetical protein